MVIPLRKIVLSLAVLVLAIAAVVAVRTALFRSRQLGERAAPPQAGAVKRFASNYAPCLASISKFRNSGCRAPNGQLRNPN
jgi:hypothetical protein